MAGRFCPTVLVIFFLSVSLVIRTDADESDVTSEEAALQRNLERAIRDAGLNDCATRGVNVNYLDGYMQRHGKVRTVRRRRRKYYGRE